MHHRLDFIRFQINLRLSVFKRERKEGKTVAYLLKQVKQSYNTIYAHAIREYAGQGFHNR